MLTGLIMKELFSVGNSIQIEFRDGQRVKRVYKTIIDKTTPDTMHLILPGETSVDVKIGTKLSVISYQVNPSDTVYLTSEIVEYQSGPPILLTIKMPVPLETVSRRKFFRCDVDLPFTYLDVEKNEHQGKVINLSASGLMAVVFYDNHLRTSQLLDCILTLPIISGPLNFTAKIIRIEHTEKESLRALAMSFENIDEKFQNIITKYLFQRQRELIKLGLIKVGRI